MPARGAFWPLWVGSGLVVLPTAFLWLMSPLGFGFQVAPTGTMGRVLGGIFWVSYFVLNPAFVLGWLVLPLWRHAGLPNRGWQLFAAIAAALVASILCTVAML